ncbi:MAG TPA: MBOAT family protein [Chroococcidiopsis sp.]
MLFNSFAFIFVFLPIALIGFFGIARFISAKMAIAWLAISSLAFYGYWSIAYLPLLGISIVFNYTIGSLIGRAPFQSQRSKQLLGLGITVNLLLLGYYKYAGFFLHSSNRLFNTDWFVPEIILPLGISFYTFTQTAYLVDAYRGETKNYDFLTYLLFVTFFPHLIAGPILHHSDVIPQFYRLRNFVVSQKNMALGLTLFTLGLAKKVLIADTISPWVGVAFSNTANLNFLEAWVGAISYTLQLYFDFSGYSDMAVGLGFMLNIVLPINFNSPYKALSITDFWRRWHITLSNFLRDYLYIPLGGNRKGQVRRYVNLLITMLLGGLWHGAGWTFIVWGGLHGLYLCINHGWNKLNLAMPKLLAWVITFVAVVIGWVLFRAHNIHDAIDMLRAMFGLKGIVLPGDREWSVALVNGVGIAIQPWNQLNLPELNDSKMLSLIALAALVAWVALLPNTQQMLARVKPNRRWAIALGGLGGVCLLYLNRVSEFLYFQF